MAAAQPEATRSGCPSFGRMKPICSRLRRHGARTAIASVASACSQAIACRVCRKPKIALRCADGVRSQAHARCHALAGRHAGHACATLWPGGPVLRRARWWDRSWGNSAALQEPCGRQWKTSYDPIGRRSRLAGPMLSDTIRPPTGRPMFWPARSFARSDSMEDARTFAARQIRPGSTSAKSPGTRRCQCRRAALAERLALLLTSFPPRNHDLLIAGKHAARPAGLRPRSDSGPSNSLRLC